MFLWNCEAASLYDYLLLVIAAASWCYAGYCLIELRYERQSSLPWWEPVPFGTTDLTLRGREYLRRFFLSFFAGICAVMLAAALCSIR
jgi:hypothetical protein